MKISKLAMVVLLMVTILCMGVAVADPVGPNSTGNPSHDDDWGGGCSGQGNYGSGQPGVHVPPGPLGPGVIVL